MRITIWQITGTDHVKVTWTLMIDLLRKATMDATGQGRQSNGFFDGRKIHSLQLLFDKELEIIVISAQSSDR